MRYFVIIWKATFLLQVLTQVKSKIIEGNLPNASLISNLIKEYVKPYIHSLVLPRNEAPEFRISKKTIIEDVIRQKILELKPFLQDNSKIIESDENLMLDDGEETTIIEFIPDTKTNKEVGRKRKDKSDAFKADILVYKKLREKITKALKTEPVSGKTVRLVTEIFDGLIAKLIGSQCMWKSSGNAEKTFRFGKTDEDKLLNMHNITKEEWEHFKKQYLKLTQHKFVNQTLLMFNKMKNFFSRVVNNTMAISNKYRLDCRVVELKNPKARHKKYLNPNVLRDHNDGDECADFEICSKELTVYMTDFYKSLNDTAVSAFRNYAAMYSRDVTTDHSVEKDSVVNLVNNVSNTVEKKVIKIFAKETNVINLDENKNREVNIEFLKKYINSTTSHVKRHIKKHLETYLKSLRFRLLLNVKRDIDVNLSVDLGNLARDFISRMCAVFVTCNGKYLSRRAKRIFHPWGDLHVKDGKSVYVKVQLTFDEALKNTIVRNRQILADILNGNTTFLKDTRRNLIEKYKNFNVTRTTRKLFCGSLPTKTNSHRNSYNEVNIGGNKIFIEMKNMDNNI